ncbi:AMP-binding protein [Bacillus sp. SCS-151]|uniref:AMP-binding protein n=1 Tax=Nanhaiella sioensis TaxID=3115293 RepID=UPI003978D195
MEQVEKIWTEHYPKEVPKSLKYEEKTMQEFLKETASKMPEKKALHFLGKEMTFAELYEQALKFANFLKEKGFKKGDTASIMLPNCPQSVIGYFGVFLAGGVVVQTNPLYMERELEHQLVDSSATFILCLDLLYPKVMNVKGKTKIEHIIVTSIKDYLPFPKNLIYPYIQKKQHGIVVTIEEDSNTHKIKSILKNYEAHELSIEVSPDEIALLQYTGGTTGLSKGVMLTHNNLTSVTTMCHHWLYKNNDKENIVLGILPFFHVYGLSTVLNFSALYGAKMILLPKFDAGDALKAIDKHKPTVFPGAPTIFIALLNHPKIKDYDLTSIQACISGSAPLPLEVQEQFEKVSGGRLVEGYGLTETSAVALANTVWEKRKLGSIGIPFPDTDGIIFSMETGEPAKVNEIGEIAIKGPQVTQGYWNRPEENEASFKDGWFLTGDLGYVDEEGFFYIVDRKKDMIIAGGYNIYPREIEEVLYENSKILEAVAAGVPDAYRGETVKAYIVLKEGEECTEEELDAFCRKHLAAYKVPRIYEFRDELPKTAVGKILRRALVDEEKEKQKKVN